MSAADSLFPPDEAGLTTKEFVAAADFAETGDFSHLDGQRPAVVRRARDLFIGRQGGFIRPTPSLKAFREAIENGTNIVVAEQSKFRRTVPSRAILDAAEAMGITEADLEHAE